MFGVVYAVLILLGWGFNNVGDFFLHPARAIIIEKSQEKSQNPLF